MARTELSVSESRVADFHVISRYLSSGVTVSDTSESKPLFDLSTVRQTVNSPNFRNYRKRIGGVSRDDLPMNPFYFEKSYRGYVYGQSSTQEVGSDLAVYRTGPHFFLGYVGSPSSIDASMRASIDSNALNASLADIKNSKVNVGVTVAEGRQTIDLILSNAKRIAGAYDRLKTGDFPGAYRTLVGSGPNLSGLPKRPVRTSKTTPSKALANEWLALQLGWKPLINEVYNYAEALAKIANKPQVIRLTSSRSHRWNVAAINPPGFSPWYDLPVRRVEYGSYTRKYVYFFTVSNQTVTSLAAIGLSNPLSWVWEKLPYSFVADWFLPIGALIDSLDGTLGYTFLKGCTTTFERSEIRHASHTRGRVGSLDHSVDLECKQYYIRCQRTVLNAFPSPALPRIDVKFSMTKGVTALALFRQLFK